jgi:hypothetical protein
MKKGFAASRQTNPPCHACFRPCSEKEDIYCKDCIASGDAVWHTKMITRWQAEVEAKQDA